MVRTVLAAVAAAAAISLIGAPTAEAKMCDKHGTGAGHIYITACTRGGGGAGPTYYWTDDDKKPHFDRASDIPASHYPAAAPS